MPRRRLDRLVCSRLTERKHAKLSAIRKLLPTETGNILPLQPLLSTQREHVVFKAILHLTSGGHSDNEGIFIWDGNQVRSIVRKGDPSPDGNGVFDGFPGTELSINDQGEVAFKAYLRETNDPATNEGIFVGDHNQLTTVIRTGTPSPNGIGFVTQLNDAFINNGGEVATMLYTNNGEVIIHFDGSLNVVASNGDVPVGSRFPLGLFGFYLNVSITEQGTVFFQTGAGVYGWDGITAYKVAEIEEPAPDGGIFTQFFMAVANKNDELACVATTSNNSGVYRISQTGVERVYLNGQPVGDRPITLLQILVPHINDLGQVVFAGNFSGASANAAYIYAVDQQGQIQKVVEIGDELNGSIVTAMSYLEFRYDSERTGLNSMGQVAFSYQLADFTSGVAVWSPEIRIAPDSANVTRGELVSGTASDLGASDNADFQARRATSDIQSRVDIVLTGSTDVLSPSSLEFTIEGSVFSRSSVNQTVELFDFDSNSYAAFSTGYCKPF